MARTSNLANVATVTRASKAWDPLWDFTSGGTVGTLTEYASGVARVGANGLLVEEASTNSIRNPRFEGATAGVIGSGGVAPTNMSLTAHAGSEIVGTGTDDGWPYIDVRVNGTPTQDLFLSFEAVNQVAASDGQTWCCAWGAKLISGTFDNFTGLLPYINVRNGALSGVQDLYGTAHEPDATHKRIFQSSTISEATVAYVQPYIRFNGNDGTTAVDFTVRIYAPQLEQKAYPTSPILPVAASPAASTRAADVVTVTAGAWASDEPYTIFCNYQPNKSGNLEYVWSISDAGSQDYYACYLNSSGHNVFVAENGLITETKTVVDLTISAGDNYKMAVRLQKDAFAFSLNGQTQVTDASWNVPTNAATKLLLGSSPFGSANLRGYIKDFRYWPRALTNAEIEALVGN